jgi:hypothetical protein
MFNAAREKSTARPRKMIIVALMPDWHSKIDVANAPE